MLSELTPKFNNLTNESDQFISKKMPDTKLITAVSWKEGHPEALWKS